MKSMPYVEDSYENWLVLRLPPADWEPCFQDGAGAALAREVPGYALVAGYVHRFIKRGSVLDAGCGEATLAQYLDLGRLTYTGFDVSSTAIARGCEDLSQGSAFVSSIEDFKADQEFDAIVFKGSLPSLDDPLGAVDRYRSYLAPDGVIIIALYVNTNDHGNSSLLARYLTAACAEGRYELIERADTTSVTYQMSWRIFVLKR